MGVHTGITWIDGDDVVSVDTTPPERTDGVVSMRIGCHFNGRREGSITLDGPPEALLDAAVQIARIAVSHHARYDPDGDPGSIAHTADGLASLVGQLLSTVDRDVVDDALAENIARNLGAAAEQWARQVTLPPSARLGMVADAVAEG